MPATVIPRTESAKNEPKLVGDDRRSQAAMPIERLDHGQSEERGITQSTHQYQRTGRGARQLQPAPDQPEETSRQAEHQPGHQANQQYVAGQFQLWIYSNVSAGSET